MPIYALAGDLAGDVVTCSGSALFGSSVALMGACVIVALTVTVGMDALRTKSRQRASELAPDSSQA